MMRGFIFRSQDFERKLIDINNSKSNGFYINLLLGNVRNIPTMQFFTGISRNTQSKLYNAIIDGVGLRFLK